MSNVDLGHSNVVSLGAFRAARLVERQRLEHLERAATAADIAMEGRFPDAERMLSVVMLFARVKTFGAFADAQKKHMDWFRTQPEEIKEVFAAALAKGFTRLARAQDAADARQMLLARKKA